MLFYHFFVLYFVTIAEGDDLSNDITITRSSKLKLGEILEKNIKTPLEINNKFRDGFKISDLESFIAESSNDQDSSVWYKVYNREEGSENEESNEPSEENREVDDQKVPLLTPNDPNGKEPSSYNFDRWCKQDKVLITVSELTRDIPIILNLIQIIVTL
eukprot:XP_766442.1 hypothetical protein [Theileria parva strain Muguga]